MKTRILNFGFLACVAGFCFGTGAALAVAPSESELFEAARWTAAKFGGVSASPPDAPPGLVVLANNDPVQLNARAGQPMRIVEAKFTRGLYCHAFSKIIVRLPAPSHCASVRGMLVPQDR